MDHGSGRDLSPSFEKRDPSLPSVTQDDRRGVSFRMKGMEKAVQPQSFNLQLVTSNKFFLQPPSIQYPASLFAFIQYPASAFHPASSLRL
jgi:hypothetical protein